MRSQQIDYTVIIPHYNIPELLGRCLRSIPERENVQVIVVDDCSPDAATYRERVPELSRNNVEFYSTSQGGSAGRARNVGIDHARGRWLTFLDADDLFVDNISEILDQYRDRPEDAMFFRTRSVYSDDLSRPSDRNFTEKLFNYYFDSGIETYLRYEFDSPWGKFVKRTLVEHNKMRFEEIHYGNDIYFNSCIGVYAKEIYVSDEVVYIVTERSGSLTSDDYRTYNEWNIRYKALKRKQELFDHHNIKNDGWTFASVLFKMWHRDKSIFFRELCRLSLRNQLRVIRYALRHFLGHHPV